MQMIRAGGWGRGSTCFRTNNILQFSYGPVFTNNYLETLQNPRQVNPYCHKSKCLQETNSINFSGTCASI